MHRRIGAALLAAAALLLTVTSVAADAITDQTLYIEPGHKAPVRCLDGSDYVISARDAAHIVIRCPGVAATPTPSPTATPAPSQPPAAPTTVGYGGAATGGEGGEVYEVSDWTELRAALEASGPRIINVTGNANLNGAGESIKVTNGDFTLDGSAWSGSIKRGWLLIKGPISNFIIREMRIRPGDQVAEVGDADALSLNAADGDVSNFIIDRSSLMWGSDIGGLSLLPKLDGGTVFNGTISNTIMGPGLEFSAHDNGTVRHAKAANIATQPSGVVQDITDMDSIPGAYNITFYRDLFTGGDERVPQVHYADNVDLVNSIAYNWAHSGIEGNPRGMNIVSTVAKAGPQTGDGAKQFFDSTPKPKHTVYPNSVYIEDPLTIGFAYSDNVPASARRGSPVNGGVFGIPSIIPASAVMDSVLADVGPSLRDVVDAEMVGHVRDGSDDYYYGPGFGSPNPYWPDTALPAPTATPTPTPTATPTPTPTQPPAGLQVVGYGSATTGGAGGTVYEVDNWGEFSAAAEASGPRIIKIIGDSNISGGGERLVVNDGDLTIDGSAWTGSLKRYSLVLRASNVIITEMRMRPGDEVADLQQGGALMLNPGVGNTMSNIVIDHSDFLWGVDANLNIFNTVTDVTVQYSLIAGGLVQSAGDDLNGYGFNTHGDEELHSRITLYRNFIADNRHRNLRAHGVNGIDFINNVVYNWGDKAADGNPVGANYVGNLFRKGPQTQASNELFNSELFGFWTEYFEDSVYWSNNWGLGFDATNTFAPGVRRSSPYGSLSVTPAPASADLADQVVDQAGPTIVDEVDQDFKDQWTLNAGTFYNGPGFPGPNPYWP